MYDTLPIDDGRGDRSELSEITGLHTHQVSKGARTLHRSTSWRWPLAIVMLIAITAWPAATRAEGATGILKVVPSADVAELDPTRAANQIGRIYAQMVFDTLFALDHALSPKPMMVDTESISADSLRHTYTLRDGLRFHDGSKVTTRDVVASLNRWMNNSAFGGQLRSRLGAMSVIDDRRFVITLKQRFGLLDFMLAGAGAPMPGIMREADALRDVATPVTEPIGSGPFRYVASERVAGHRVVFARNPDYPTRSEPPDGLAGGRVVKVDRVEWDILPDPTTTASALVTGEVDVWDTVTSDLVGFLRSHGVTARRTASLQASAYIRPNFQLPPFNDQRARQALALLFDQKDFMQAVAGEALPWRECYSFSVCGSVLGTEVGSEPYRPPSIAKARQLLAEAGYRGEPIIFVATPQLPIIDAIAQVATQRLREAGVTVDLQMGDWAVVFKRINTPNQAIGHGGYHLFASYSLGGTWFNPLTNVALNASCGATNFAGFPCDAEGEVLREKVLAAGDDAGRMAAFQDFQRRMWQFIPYVPVGQFDMVNAYRSNISGILDSYVIAYWNIEKR